MMVRRPILGGLFALAVGVAAAADFSTERESPTPVPPTGKITGSFPADENSETYYLSTTTGAGALFVRLQYAGSGEIEKEIAFAVAEDGRLDGPVTLQGSKPTDQKMQTIQMKAPGQHVFAITAQGPAEASFCVLLGGPAFPNAVNVQCDLPVTAPAAPQAAPSPPPVAAAAPPEAPKDAPESCQRRIRLESDDLFSGATASLREDAGSLLAAIGRQLLASQHPVRVECDTDLPGEAGHKLSEQRAAAVREFFVAFGVRAARIETQGFGATRLLTPGKKPGSAETPENRRVEIVICPS